MSINKESGPEKALAFRSFREFWPYYVMEHRHPTCRSFHYIGTTLTFLVIAFSLFFKNPWILLLMPVVGYGFAWLGHFVFEKNRPATFKYPFYSLMGDYYMYFKRLTGQMDQEIKKAEDRYQLMSVDTKAGE